MIGTAMIFHADDREMELVSLTAPPTLDFLKGAVGGWIQLVPLFDTIQLDDEGSIARCVAYCNEEGKLENLPVNREATRLWDRSLRRLRHDGKPLYPTGLVTPDGTISDVLCGSIVVLIGDKKFVRSL